MVTHFGQNWSSLKNCCQCVELVGSSFTFYFVTRAPKHDNCNVYTKKMHFNQRISFRTRANNLRLLPIALTTGVSLLNDACQYFEPLSSMRRANTHLSE